MEHHLNRKVLPDGRAFTEETRVVSVSIDFDEHVPKFNDVDQHFLLEDECKVSQQPFIDH